MAQAYWCCYHSYLTAMRRLGDAELGRLVRAAISYSSTGEEPELRGNEIFYWDMVRDRINADKDHYDAVCASRSKAARSRWGDGQAKAHKSMQMHANAYKEKEKEYTPLPPTEPLMVLDDKLAELAQSYEANIGQLTRASSEALASWLERYDAELVKAAIDCAAMNGARSAGYVQAILKRCHDQGILTAEQFRADTERRQNAKAANAAQEDRRPRF